MAIYLNQSLRVASRHLSSADVFVKGVSLGEFYPKVGGQIEFIPTPRNQVGTIYRGLQQDLIIGKTASGRLRIQTVKEEKEVYAILTSRLMQDVQGVGTIRYLRNHEKPVCKVQAIKRDDPTTTWQEIIAKVRPGDAFWVRWVMQGQVDAMVYYMDDKNKIHEIIVEDLHDYCSEHRLNDLPFTISDINGDVHHSKLIKNEWVAV